MPNPIKNNLVIELHVPDFAPIKDFYNKIGFSIIAEDKKTEDFLGYLVMQRKDALGTTILNFYGDAESVSSQSYFTRFPRDTIRGYGVEVTIPVSDIESVYKHVSGLLGGHLVQELKEMRDSEYRWKDFRLADPYGFYVRMSELMDWGQ